MQHSAQQKENKLRRRGRRQAQSWQALAIDQQTVVGEINSACGTQKEMGLWCEPRLPLQKVISTFPHEPWPQSHGRVREDGGLDPGVARGEQGMQTVVWTFPVTLRSRSPRLKVTTKAVEEGPREERKLSLGGCESTK